MSARDFADRRIQGGAAAKFRFSGSLKEALRLVETLGLAPLARIWAAQPKNYIGPAYSQWSIRRREVETEVAAKLREAGAFVDPTSDGARFRFAGFTGSSTQGLQQALRNWKAAAEKRLNGSAR